LSVGNEVSVSLVGHLGGSAHVFIEVGDVVGQIAVVELAETVGEELLSNLVYGHQAAFLSD
jgi:hypothetical protein